MRGRGTCDNPHKKYPRVRTETLLSVRQQRYLPQSLLMLKHVLDLCRNVPSIELQSMSWFSGFFRAGYLLKRLATNARLSLGFPRTTSFGMTNWRQPRRSACSSIRSALFRSSFSCKETETSYDGYSSPRTCLCHTIRTCRRVRETLFADL